MKTIGLLRTSLSATALSSLLFGAFGQATYPDSLWVKVIFYDYFVDYNGTNPDFERSCCGLRAGMVNSTLDNQLKPVPTAVACPTPSSAFPSACHLAEWFRVSGNAGSDPASLFVCDSTDPEHKIWSWTNLKPYLGRAGEYTGNNYNANYNMRNIIIYDSLPFLHQGNGVYNYTDNSFFKLDNRGFGNQPTAAHNYGFTMELHTTFAYKKGLTFNFAGDDDVWVFVNGQLMMDLGGIHGVETGSFNLDAIPGLIEGKYYNFDLFYAERHTSASNIEITSNIIAAQPNNIEFTVFPSDTIKAGDTAMIIGALLDMYGKPIPALSDSITWSVDPATFRTGDVVIVPRGDTTRFTATLAPHTVNIIGRYTGNGQVYDTVQLYIIPAAPHHLVIEPAGTPLPNNDNPIGTTTIGPAVSTARGYAVLRDRFQNFVGYSQSTLWGSNQTLVVTVPSNGGGNAAIGEGIFTKVGPVGTARVGAMDIGLGFKDTVTVIVSKTEYDSLAIFKVAGGVYTRINRADTLSLALLDSAVLVVRGRRTDTREWELVPGNWDITAALKAMISRQPPQNSNSWSFYPNDTGRGYISVSLQNNASSTIRDSIHVLFKPGSANVIEIYSRLGAPSATNAAWPTDPRVADTMSADSIYTLLYAKVFNYTARPKVWLRSFEEVYDSSRQIRWSVSPVDQEDSLIFATGNHTELKATQAYRLVRVTASLGTLTPCSILLWVVPGRAHHIVIEGSTAIQGAALYNDQPLSNLVIESDQTQASAFAIVRDMYGNFINYSNPTQWVSTNTALFRADTGITNVGEGLALRVSDSGHAFMIGINSTAKPGTVLRDTVPVELQNITYLKLRIYVMDGPNKVYPDTVRISTDASLTLYAEGKRSDDTTRWVPVPVQWIKTIGLKTVENPPASPSLNWNVIPDSIGTGLISVNRPDAGTFSVPAVFTEGPADRIVLYRRTGDPSKLFPFPKTDTIMAGRTDTLVGKIFDRNGAWLSRFENGNVSQSVISWSIARTAGPVLAGTDIPDTLSTRAGHISTFTPRIAYSTYHVVVQYKDSAKTRVDSANIYVLPGAADHLVIEPSAEITGTRLINDNPFNPDTIRFGSRDNTKNAFAVIRDRFGNFVGFSTNTLWTSLNNQLVTTADGARIFGEGLINRFPGALTGATGVSAVDRQNPNLSDVVGIVLDAVDYDSLKIVVRDNIDISSLQMRSDQDTLLQVLGKRSTDGLWVPVSGNWTYTATLGGTSIAGQSLWRFRPGDTGTGTIMVSMGTSAPDMITVKILPGLPKSVVIYNSELPPGPGVVKLPDPSQVITVSAGTPYLLVAKVFDWKGIWLSQYQSSNLQNLITWGASDPDSNLNRTLDGLIGAVRRFTPTRAYDTVTIIDTLRADAFTMYMDTVRFAVTPGPAARLIIEPKGPINLVRPNELDTLRILSNEQSKSAYSTIRDKYGNFIRYADVSLWGSLNTTIVTVQKGDNLFGEGIAFRNQTAVDSITKIHAADAVISSLKDSCNVKLIKFYYLKLRIVIGSDKNPDSLVMNTNQDSTIKVQGLLSTSTSTDSIWVDIPSAIWENSSNLKTDPIAPVSDSWRFSPTDTASGWIRVTLNNDGVTMPDTLRVHFTPGPPVRASIVIITPPADLIAGKPIQAVVQVYDRHGNSYSYTFDTTAGRAAAYHDILGTGGLTFPEPFIIVDGDTIFLDPSSTDRGNQTFVNGRDTVSFTLFNAPFDTTQKHQIFTNLIIGRDTILAASTPFVLRPDTLAEIRIVYPNGTPVTDTLNLTGPVTIISRGYDRYGNRIGDIPADWRVTDSLHQITGPVDGSSITYDSRSVIKNERGYIIVDHDGIRDSIYVIIAGPLIRLVRAITRDTSGNGILDRMELYFSRKFELPAGASFAGLTIVANQRDTLIVKRILNAGSDRDDSVWVVELTESHTTQPQTAWTPKVHLPFQKAYDLADATIIATDGAGPVVWRVENFNVVASRHDLDTVVVTFSEPVQRWDGGSLNANDKPMDLFYVWERDPRYPDDTARYVLVRDMFKGINNLKRDPGRSAALTFTMSNGNDLNRAYFLSIADSARKYVTDTTVNAVRPNTNNRPRRVIVVPIQGNISILMNPVGPIFTRVPAGAIDPVNNPNASRWVASDHRGAVIKFPFFNPPPEVLTDPGTLPRLKFTMKIYDVIGNVVQSAENSDFLSNYTKSELENQASLDASIYWNGSNGEGMAVAPGVYRVVVYLQYQGVNGENRNKYKDQRMIAKLGIQR